LYRNWYYKQDQSGTKGIAPFSPIRWVVVFLDVVAGDFRRMPNHAKSKLTKGAQSPLLKALPPKLIGLIVPEYQESTDTQTRLRPALMVKQI